MNDRIKVIQYGIGPIGIKMLQYAAERASLEIVGAVDIDPAKIGKDVGELAGLPAPLGVTVSGDASELLGRVEADAVILTTSSSLEQIRPQVLQIVSFGKNVVSSCEELMYPWLTQPDLAEEIDRAARGNDVSVLATGVNPGFLMDFLPLVMTGVCKDVRKVTVERIQNAQYRRLPFQKKIGAGLSLDEFSARAEKGVLRHVGLIESIHLIATGLGWELEKAEDILSPVIARERIETPDLVIEPGQASGVNQIGKGFVKGEEVITLYFEAAVGAAESRERILIEGTPNIDLTIKNGVNGDVATCAILTNAIPVVVDALPGLRTMADVRAIACRS
ncbi:MAG: dihydrodipicolinate reductase [Syntrophobacteraceae bacterium]